MCEAAGIGTVPDSPGGSRGRAKGISATSNTLIQLHRGGSGAGVSVPAVTYRHCKGYFLPFSFFSLIFWGKDWTELYEWDNQSEQKKESVWVLCLSRGWFASTSICLEKTGLCHYINTTECTTTPEDISIKLDREDVSAWISQAVLLCHPSLQGISQQCYKKNISIPSILTIILICLNWHSPVDSLFKSYTHCYVFIP